MLIGFHGATDSMRFYVRMTENSFHENFRNPVSLASCLPSLTAYLIAIPEIMAERVHSPFRQGTFLRACFAQ